MILTVCRSDQPKSDIDRGFISDLHHNEALILFHNPYPEPVTVLFSVEAKGVSGSWEVLYDGKPVNSLLKIALPPATSDYQVITNYLPFMMKLKSSCDPNDRLKLVAQFVPDTSVSGDLLRRIEERGFVVEGDPIWTAEVMA